MEAIKLENYFKLIHPEYTYIQIIPHKSIRNYNSSNIAKAISTTYKTINRRIKIEQKKLFFETNFKISYIMDFKKDNAEFYFIIPSVYKSLLLDKITEIWKQATIKEVETIAQLSGNLTTYSLGYKKDDCLSLNVDKKSNEPLNSIMNVMDIMQNDDTIRIAYNFMPTNQIGWKDRYAEMERKVKEHKPLDKKITSWEYILKQTLNIILGTIDCVLEVLQDFTGADDKNINRSITSSLLSYIQGNNDISISTKKKKEATIINTQIAVISKSADKVRMDNNALSVCHAYNSISEDNELVYKKVKNEINIEDYDYKIESSLFSSDECQNFIQIPADTLLKDYNINHIETIETNVPEELQKGIMCIGTNVCKGTETKAYLSTDKDFRNLPLCPIAPNRAGKTTLLKHLSKDAINNGECVILFDFCGECEFSNDVSKSISKEKVLNIDCSDFNNLQGLGFNEIKPKNNNTFDIYKSAKMQTSMLVSFINSINIDNELEPRMNRYLKAGSLVVFINNGSIKDVFNVLQDHIARKQFINKIPRNQLDNMQEYILALNELDEWSKSKEKEVIGTKISYVQSILNRLDIIKSNPYMELMLKKDCKNNIDLAKEIQKNKLICIKMPETMFSTAEEKDAYCTYWINKIWGALQQRHAILKEANRTKVNIFVDELYQVPCCQTFLKKILNQIAKKTAKIIISAHSLEQIKYIRPELKNASTSYMLLAGCGKDNFKELKEELYPYELEDLLALKRYTSLNLIKTKNGYARFITKLPK